MSSHRYASTHSLVSRRRKWPEHGSRNKTCQTNPLIICCHVCRCRLSGVSPKEGPGLKNYLVSTRADAMRTAFLLLTLLLYCSSVRGREVSVSLFTVFIVGLILKSSANSSSESVTCLPGYKITRVCPI